MGETFDTKILAAVMGVRVARLHQMLIAAEFETVESVTKMHEVLLKTALETPKSKPLVVAIDPDGAPVTKQ